MGCNYKNWAVTIKKCTKRVISLKYILFLEFENFNFITCCACNISLDFNVIQLYFEIIFNRLEISDKNISDPIKMWEFF